MLNLVKRIMVDESAASATEYAILLAFVGAAVVLALGVFGTDLSKMFTLLGTKMANWVS